MNFLLEGDNRKLMNFNRDLKSNKDFLVWFYADWCGHCTAMKDEWEKLCSKCNNKYNLAKIRDDVAPKLTNNLGNNIEGYPKIVLISNGKEKKEYQGPRDAQNLFNFLKQHAKTVGPQKKKRNCSRKMRKPMRIVKVKVPCGKRKSIPRRRSRKMIPRSRSRKIMLRNLLGF